MQWLNIALAVIALGSMINSWRSARTAQRALDVANRVGQVTYENARASSTPVATLELTEVEHRRPAARDPRNTDAFDAGKWAVTYEADSLEVVARGHLTNNSPHELLLTLHDHPNSGRRSWQSFRNQSVFFLDKAEVCTGRTVLPGNAKVAFEWIDRRSRDEWIALHDLDHPGDGTSSPRIPPPTWRDYLRALLDTGAYDRLRRHKTARSGFYIVCESRTSERVATIWHAAVVATPITANAEDEETGRSHYSELLRTINGPIDDDTIRYRADSDPALARLHTPRYRWLHGRN